MLGLIAELREGFATLWIILYQDSRAGSHRDATLPGMIAPAPWRRPARRDTECL